VAVAEVDGRPVGKRCLDFSWTEGPAFAFAFDVQPEWRGRGIGTLIDDHLGWIALANGFRVLRTVVVADNARGLAWRERLGYLPVEEERSRWHEHGAEQETQVVVFERENLPYALAFAPDVTIARHYRWDDMPKETLNALLGRRMITGERVMLTHVYMEPGVIVPMHSHENEQLTYILEGTLRFWLGDDESEPVDVHAGEVLYIPPNLPHKAEALERTLDVDIFSPPREDWLAGTDDYLRSAPATPGGG
jgi:quercetin dioxygenase-like cupin family protein